MRGRGDASQSSDASRHMGPRLKDVASVPDGLRAVWLASDGPEDVSKTRTRHLACGMAMGRLMGLGGAVVVFR